MSCLALCALASVLPAAAATGDAAPSLRPNRLGIPVFVGSRFHPGARVTVTLRNGARRHVHEVRASVAGSFVVRFGHVAIDPCRGTLSVTALDGRGARATWTRVCRPPSTTDPSPA